LLVGEATSLTWMLTYFIIFFLFQQNEMQLILVPEKWKTSTPKISVGNRVRIRQT
jgi:hypothetical protein